MALSHNGQPCCAERGRDEDTDCAECVRAVPGLADGEDGLGEDGFTSLIPE